jgi:hypothetical protein
VSGQTYSSGQTKKRPPFGRPVRCNPEHRRGQYGGRQPTLQATAGVYVFGTRRSPLPMGCGVLATAMVRARTVASFLARFLHQFNAVVLDLNTMRLERPDDRIDSPGMAAHRLAPGAFHAG